MIMEQDMRRRSRGRTGTSSLTPTLEKSGMASAVWRNHRSIELKIDADVDFELAM
jgi:hypothetical protein